MPAINRPSVSVPVSAPRALAHPRIPFPSIIEQVLMRALGFQVKRAQVLKMAQEVDPNHGGAVDFETYLEISEWADLADEDGRYYGQRTHAYHTTIALINSEGPVRDAGPGGGGPEGVPTLRRGRHRQGTTVVTYRRS